MSTNLIPASTQIASVHLRVRRLEAVRAFYVDLLGLVELPGGNAKQVHLGASPTGPALVELLADPLATPRPPRTTGLYHTAFLFSSHQTLGRVLLRLLQARWPLQGAADHGVSEAIYLADPEGNGIELYVDRPAADWPRQNGVLAMVSEPLDLNPIVRAGAEAAPPNEQPARIGHIHLNVSDLEQTERFYSALAGFEVMQRSYAGALFLAAGGYHHHIGANIWNGRNVPAAPPNSTGLAAYTIQLPDAPALAALNERLSAGGFAAERGANSLQLLDPAGIGVSFRI